MTEPSAGSLIPYPKLQLFAVDEIENAIESHPGILKIVEGNVKTYAVVNIAETMKALSRVGQLLQLAYAGSKGFACSEKIVRIMTDYQNLLAQSKMTSAGFVEVSINALKRHRIALLAAESGKLKESVTLLSSCEKMAGEMAKCCDTLVTQCETLRTQSVDALISAVQNSNATAEQKKATMESIKEFKVQEEVLKQETQDLIAHLAEEKKNEQEAQAAVKNAQNAQLAATVASAFATAFTTPILEVLASFAPLPRGHYHHSQNSSAPENDNRNLLQKALEEREKSNQEIENAKIKLAGKEAKVKQGLDPEETNRLSIKIAKLKEEIKVKEESLKKQQIDFETMQTNLSQMTDNASQNAARIAERRASLQEKLRKKNADLKESIEKLKTLNTNNNDLDKSIVALDVTTKALGQIETTFKNTRVYWECVQRLCKALANNEDLKITAELGIKDEFVDQVKTSGLNWLANFKISRGALLALQEVDGKYDRIMNDLPSQQEVSRLINEVAPALLNEINKDNNNNNTK